MKIVYSPLLFILLVFGLRSYAQMGDYSAKRKIVGITEQWHALELPTAVFNGVLNDLSDIRIFGISPNDTIEAPYLLKVGKAERVQHELPFELINVSKKNKVHYFTFEVPTHESLNEIILDFATENFDWKVTLEGSQDQSDWFTILRDSRILSVKNEQTDYRFTHLNFPNAKFRYYRISFKSGIAPELQGAHIFLNQDIEAQYKNMDIAHVEISRDKDLKQTILDIDLDQRAPISFLNLDIENGFDYYRSFQIQYALDSTNTEKGTHYGYRTLYRGTLNSIEKNGFRFNSVMARKLKIIIEDHDNQPLNIKNVQVKGYVHWLMARFSENRDYFLVYGNANAHPPKYDIAYTSKNIPETLDNVGLGNEIRIPKKKKAQPTPLFKNKLWLWGILGTIILVLGGFTLKMMSKKES